MRRPVIYLRPVNGLGNRMRALAAGRALAAAVDARLVVFWEVVPDLAIRYEELFVPTGDFTLRNVEPARSLWDAALFIACGEMKSVRGVPTEWISRLAFPVPRLRNLRPEHYAPADLEDLVRRSGRVLIDSWWAFYGGASLDFSFYKLQPRLAAAVDATASRFGPRPIGVHIRRADNVNAIRFSPTSAFVAAMRRCVDEDSETTFFLATDSAETEREIVDFFGDRVVTRPREHARNSRQGMFDAAVDMFLLSRTTWILGSYYSTFSETGASLGGIAWVTVTNDKSLAGRINSDIVVVEDTPKAATP